MDGTLEYDDPILNACTEYLGEVQRQLAADQPSGSWSGGHHILGPLRFRVLPPARQCYSQADFHVTVDSSLSLRFHYLINTGCICAPGNHLRGYLGFHCDAIWGLGVANMFWRKNEVCYRDSPSATLGRSFSAHSPTTVWTEATIDLKAL
jgi:hypothetical protein